MKNPSHRPAATSMTPVSRWLWQPRLSASPRLRLFCLPYAGGSASIYRDWFARVPADIDLCPIQLPGREGRFAEALIDDPQTLLDELHKAVQPWLDRPFVLLGYSMGALIAHALAQRLQATGGPPPQRLVVAACSSPDHAIKVDPDRMSDAEFAAYVRALGGTPEAVFEHAELLGLLLPLLKADFRLVRRLREAARTAPDALRLDCPITALAAHQDEHATPQQVARWADFTRGALNVTSIPGGHFALWQQARLLIDAALGPCLPAQSAAARA
jgi:surfactin synthase thioesterase subunit